MSFTHISLGPWTTFFFLISKKDVYLKSCFMSTQLKKKKLLYAKRAQSKSKVTKMRKEKEWRRKLITKKKRTKEQRERITRCESPSPKPVKNRTTKWSKQLVIGSVQVLKSPLIMLPRAVQTTWKSDPPGQTDRTRTVCCLIQLLQRLVLGPYFSKLILADRVWVSSSNTQATRPDCHINGFKGLGPYFPKSSSHS